MQVNEQSVWHQLAHLLRSLMERRSSMLIDDKGIRHRRIDLVEIRNFRNLPAVQCRTAAINIFIGRNNSGKTNLMVAMAMLFPEAAIAELRRFASTVGPHYGFLPAPYHFVRIVNDDGESSQSAVGVRAIGVGRWATLHPSSKGITIAWGSGSTIVACLQLDAKFERYRLDRTSSIPDLKLSRLRRGSLSRAWDEVMQLQQDMWGSTIVSFHQGGADEGLYLDELEQRLIKYSERLSPTNFITAVERWFRVPKLAFTRIIGLEFMVLPTSAQARRRDEEILRLQLIRKAVQETLDQTKSTGRRILKYVDDELLARRGDLDARRQLGGGLALAAGSGPGGIGGAIAKTLGSGYRSLLVLAHKVLTSDICVIDEPETYLHPGLQEMLASFLMAHSQRCQIFLSTHSHVLLNALSDSDSSQIYELFGEIYPPIKGHNALRKVDTTGLARVLDNLGVNAAQILLANAVIWVEGPSDRIYVNRWIALWSDNSLIEGRDFICMPYGGSLLSHLSLGPTADRTLTKLTRMCRHSIVVMDSDRTTSAAPVNATKQRICREAESTGGLGWITKGREIENYISHNTLRNAGYDPSSIRDEFADVPSILGKSRGRARAVSKVALARAVVEVTTARSDLEENRDLVVMLERICQQLRKWQGEKIL